MLRTCGVILLFVCRAAWPQTFQSLRGAPDAAQPAAQARLEPDANGKHGSTPIPTHGSHSEPEWTPISMPLYFHYFNGSSQTQPAPGGPYTLYFPGVASGPAIPDQLGCTWQGNAPPYYFSNGAPIPDGVIQRSSPATGTVFLTGPESAIRGIGFVGQFTTGVDAGKSHIVGSVYYSNNDCYAGTLEYGFFYDYFADAPVFYLEHNANCPPNTCFEDLAGKIPAVDCSIGFTIPALPLSKGSQADGKNSHGAYDWHYRATVFREGRSYSVRVQALDPYDGSDGLSDANGQQCIIDPNAWSSADPLAAFQYCPASRVIYAGNTCDATFPTERLMSGGAVTVGVVKGDAVADPPASDVAMQVTEVEVAK